MTKASPLPRGFKAKAERLAAGCRNDLQLHVCAPLCAFKLAEHLKIPIYPATEFIKDPSEIRKLLGTETSDSGWSALTMPTKKKNRIIIHNPFHSSARQQSNLMHELAHVLCDHKYTTTHVGFNIPMGMRFHDEQQEGEANYLGSCLQVTRPGLLWALKKKMSIPEIAAYFTASVDMVNFRINSTGVRRQLSYYGNS